MRTQEEILARIEEAKNRDMFGFEWQEYIYALDYENAKPYLNLDVTKEHWDKDCKLTRTEISARAKDYLEFWLEKIEDERGISVIRATMHFKAWKWLLGHDDADTFPGSMDSDDGGWYQRTAYEHIKNQIDSGEWDKMTKQ